EDVVALCAEDQLDLLAQSLGLLQDDIGVDEARAIELIAVDGEVLPIRLVDEGGGRRAGDLAGSDDGSATRRVWRADHLRSVCGIGMEAVAGTAKIEGQSRLDLLDAGDLDALEDMPDQAPIQIRAADADGQAPGSGHGTAMADIEVGAAVLGAKVEAVAREKGVTRTRHDGIAPVVEGV